MRVLATSLRRHVAGTALENLQQGLLHAFSGNVSRDGNVIRFAANLVDFINIDDADFGTFHIVIGVLQQPQNDVLDIFAHIACFG